MKRFALLLAALLCLLAIPGFAEMVETLPVPEDCQVKENYIGQNSVSYLDYSNMADPLRGWVGEKTAMFMEDTPEGRVFAADYSAESRLKGTSSFSKTMRAKSSMYLGRYSPLR